MTTYTQLLALRVLTGISIGGATPIIFSILADYYPGSKRIRVSTLLGISMSGGIKYTYMYHDIFYSYIIIIKLLRHSFWSINSRPDR